MASQRSCQVPRDPRQSWDDLCSCVFVYVQEEGREQQGTGSGSFLLAACSVLTVYPTMQPPGTHNRSSSEKNGQNFEEEGLLTEFQLLSNCRN